MTIQSIKLLLIEDSEDDVLLLLRQLKKADFEVTHTQIESAAELTECLLKESWDLVITDHTLPTFNSLDAIKILNELQPELPLIVLSGTIDQNIAIESMRLGARDFIMKDDTSRLIPAISRELKEASTRKHMRKTELILKNNIQGIMKYSPAFIYIKDLQGCYTFINKKGEELLNKNNDEIVGKTDIELFNSSEAQRLKQNDDVVIKTGHSITSEEKIKIAGKLHIFSSIKYPLFDDAGEIYAVCGIATDITEKKYQEEQLRRSQKMEAIGQLSGGIAHDFNNQLGIVTGYLEFLDDFFQRDDQQKKWVQNATSAAQHCIGLTRQLLSFSRHSARKKTTVNINDVLINLKDMLEHSITPQIELIYTLADNLWLIEIEVSEFQDVILNLVINARDAMPNGGKLTIKTKNAVLNHNSITAANHLPSGDFVQMLVTDTGHGIDEETMERIFEPFFTTKDTGKGTGLGLSILYGFVNSYDGDVSVTSEKNVGTTFTLSLQRCHSKLSVQNTTTKKKALSKGSECILVVDDESGLLHLTKIYLSEQGYQVHLAENATEALEVLSRINIDLLFSDVIMPGKMNGYELAKIALEQQPDIKVIITSGYTTESINIQGLKDLKDNLLSKPYSRNALLTRIRQSLDTNIK